MQSYLDIVDNESSIEELITTKYPDDYFHEYFSLSINIDAVNKNTKIECLRKVNNSYYYSIHITESNVYFIFFYKNIDGILMLEYALKYSTYVDSDMLNIEENNTTLDQLRDRYPILKIFYPSHTESKNFGRIYYSDGSVYLIYVDYIGDEVYVTDYILCFSSLSNIYYNMLFDFDKDVIFDYDDI
jgi:hypothetical protein